MNIYPRKNFQQPQKKTETKKTCKIKIKKGKDGSITKEVVGECTKDQLRALGYSEGD